MFGSDPYYTTTRKQYYKYTYLNAHTKKEQILYIPIKEKIIKMLDFDKSIILKKSQNPNKR